MGQIQGETRAFSAQMKEHSDSMRTVANVKAMEQYKKLLDQFKFQLDDRNAKVAKQTRNAAMAQGYVQVGDKFIKKGATAGVYGAVNAYEYFDTENEFIKALSETGVDSVNGEGLVTFLKEKSQIEVTAYFHTQKLAIQSAMNKLMGTGDASVRESSRDVKDIGRIGVWIGGQGNSDLANRTLTEMNKQGLFSRDAYMRDLLANNAMFGGFGQLGSATWRPGEKQILGGFYTQLSWMGGEMGKRDAAHSQGRFAADPLTTTLNQFNVGSMLANSHMNVEMAVAMNGKSKNYMWEAQAIAMVKQPLVAVGSALTTAAVAGGVTAWMAPVGMAITALGNSIHVDTRTGKRSMKMTDKAAISTAVSILASVTGGLGNSAEPILKAANLTAQLAQSTVRYDENGRSQGMSIKSNNGDHHGENAGLAMFNTAIGIAVSSKIGGGLSNSYFDAFSQSFGNDMFKQAISTSVNVATEYGKFKSWGAEHSGYLDMQRQDLRGFGSIYGGALVSGFQGGAQYNDQSARVNRAADLQRANKSRAEIKQIMEAEGTYDKLVENYLTRNDANNQQQGAANHLRNILAGVAARRRESSLGGRLWDDGLILNDDGSVRLADTFNSLGNQISSQNAQLKGLNQRLRDKISRDLNLSLETDISRFVENYAKYSGKSEKAVLKDLLFMNDAESVDDLEFRHLSGFGIKFYKGVRLGKDFHRRHYNDSVLGQAGQKEYDDFQDKKQKFEQLDKMSAFLEWEQKNKPIQRGNGSSIIRERARKEWEARRNAKGISLLGKKGFENLSRFSDNRKFVPVN